MIGCSSFHSTYFLSFGLNHILITSVASELCCLHSTVGFKLKGIYQASWPNIHFGDPLSRRALHHKIMTLMMPDLWCAYELASLGVQKEELKSVDILPSFSSDSNKVVIGVDVLERLPSESSTDARPSIFPFFVCKIVLEFCQEIGRLREHFIY